MSSTATCGKCGEEVALEILPPGYAHTGPPIPPEAIWICEDCWNEGVASGDLTGIVTGTYEQEH